MGHEQKIRTPEEVRAEFVSKGQSIASWARDNNVRVTRAYDVLSGRNRGVRGEAHTVAVLLQLKQGEISES